MSRRANILPVVILTGGLVAPLTAQDPVSVATAISPREATVSVGFDDGSRLILSVTEDQLWLGSAAAGAADSLAAENWRGVVRRIGDGSSAVTALAEIRHWLAGSGLPTDLRTRAEAYLAAPGAGVAPSRGPLDGVFTYAQSTTIPPDAEINGHVVVTTGNLTVGGRVNGDAVSLRGDVRLRRGALVRGSVMAPQGRVENDGATIGGRTVVPNTGTQTAPGAVGLTVDRVASTVGVFLALAAIGLGFAFFVPQHVQLGAETIGASFGRSFAAGLVGQVLLAPTFVMLMVGLALTVVGIIAMPFIAAAFAIGVAVASLGGFVAVAHAVGERFAHHRAARLIPFLGTSSFSFIMAGLLLFALMWIGAALLGAIPVAGPLLLAVAVGATWVAFTAGFGVVLLTRFGYRESFAGRLTPQLTDEFLWPSPAGTPPAQVHVKRPRPNDS